MSARPPRTHPSLVYRAVEDEPVVGDAARGDAPASATAEDGMGRVHSGSVDEGPHTEADASASGDAPASRAVEDAVEDAGEDAGDGPERDGPARSGVRPLPGVMSDALASIRGAEVLRIADRAARPRVTAQMDPVQEEALSARMTPVDPLSPVQATRRARAGVRATQEMSFEEMEAAIRSEAEAAHQMTAVEGLAAVGGASGVRATGSQRAVRPRVHPELWRALPLALLAAVGAGAFAVVVIGEARNEAAGEDADAGGQGATSGDLTLRVSLAAVEATIGLTEQNKEDVLIACMHSSSNANHECRTSYLRDELGEYPSRIEAFPALEVDAYEVSNGRYEGCVAAGACPARDIAACRFYSVNRYELGVAVPETFLDEEHPAVCVTLDEARAFCTSEGMRLPTATEWERIARSGDDRLLPWGAFWTPAIMNWAERDMMAFPIPGRLDGYELTAPVDEFPDGKTPEGVFNLFGNVAEWVEPSPGDPEGETGTLGGSYADDTRELRATRRERMPAGQRRTTVGFRCVAAPGG